MMFITYMSEGPEDGEEIIRSARASYIRASTSYSYTWVIRSNLHFVETERQHIPDLSHVALVLRSPEISQFAARKTVDSSVLVRRLGSQGHSKYGLLGMSDCRCALGRREKASGGGRVDEGSDVAGEETRGRDE